MKTNPTPTHSPTETPTLKEAQDACKSYYEPSGQLRGCTCGTCPTNPPTETGKAIGYLSDCCNDPNGYTDITNGCNRCGKCDKPCKIHPPTSPTVEKWESRYNKFMADCWDDHIRTFPQADTREWNSGFDTAQGLAEDFIHSLIKKSVQEAKAEERERIHEQIAKIANYEMVDKGSKLSYKWLLMQMESEDHKASLKQEDDK